MAWAPPAMRKVSPASTNAVKHLWVHFDVENAEPCIARTAAIATPIAPANDLKYFFIISSLSCCVWFAVFRPRRPSMAGMFAPATYWPLIQKAGVALTPSFVPKSMCSRRSASAFLSGQAGAPLPSS